MRTVFSKSPSPARSTPPPSPVCQTFSESLTDEDIEVAQSIITKWDSSDSSSYCNIAYLFSSENCHKVKQYLNSIKHLQRAMQYFVSENPVVGKLVRAQNLMENAMKRLQKEFYQILKSNMDHLDSESVSSHSSRASPSRSSFWDFKDESDYESMRENETISEMERASTMLTEGTIKS
ncbi:hypothetical protein SLEP1_g43526 [Rubroshorea leprosula]|uniref:Uncharacterized protein n=1 Tax=Rubroshorea leprosula TaxID=152421 RepID=A0AAV5LD87_9ROSI|nr:hypothetical protein SLEP1_g43526 [Rubroshorea leprosula]